MKEEKEEMEICVKCGCVTNIPVNMHIDMRTYYVEGAGQLCNKCYNAIYDKK